MTKRLYLRQRLSASCTKQVFSLIIMIGKWRDEMTNMGKIAVIHAKLMMTSFLEIMTCLIKKKIIATFCWADATNIFKINHFIVNPQCGKKDPIFTYLTTKWKISWKQFSFYYFSWYHDFFPERNSEVVGVIFSISTMWFTKVLATILCAINLVNS